MHHFEYRNGVLNAEKVNLSELADEVGTPFYCYSTATLERHYKVFLQAFRGLDAAIYYAIKANSNQAVIRTLAELGAGMDVVSEGEVRRALAVGVAPSKIVFAGVGKTKTEMAFALKSGVQHFNVESEPELEALSQVATSLGIKALVALRINPDVDPKTHKKISTGKSETKFGIPYNDAPRLYSRAESLLGIEAVGVHMHLGSQITDLAPYRAAFTLMRQLVQRLRADGIDIRHVDLGGGLGVPYRGTDDVPPSPEAYAAVVRETVGDLGLKIMLEPGRLIVGNAGVLVTRVIYVKKGGSKTFAVVDAAMNDLIRPTLYDAYHDVRPVLERRGKGPTVRMDLVGPVCETGDFFAFDRDMPPLAAGELIAFMTAGAYGAVQSGTYNTRLLVPEVLVKGEDYAVVRPRQTFEELIGLDKFAMWQLRPRPVQPEALNGNGAHRNGVHAKPAPQPMMRAAAEAASQKDVKAAQPAERGQVSAPPKPAGAKSVPVTAKPAPKPAVKQPSAPAKKPTKSPEPVAAKKPAPPAAKKAEKTTKPQVPAKKPAKPGKPAKRPVPARGKAKPVARKRAAPARKPVKAKAKAGRKR